MRIKSAVQTKKHKKKYFRIAKVYYSNKRNRWRAVKQQVEKSLVSAYRDRKKKKRYFKSLWILRINSLSRESGLSYSRFIAGLKKAGVEINRKMLADLATQDVNSFRQLAEVAKAALK